MASSFIYNYAKTMNMSVSGPSICYWSSTTASFYITLLSNNYTPSEAHVYASAFSGAELSSTSFTGGYSGTMRLSLVNRILRVNNTSNQVEFTCDGFTWSGLSAGTAHAFVVIQQTTSDGLSPLITYNSLGGFPITTNGTNFTLSLTSAGIFDGVDV